MSASYSYDLRIRVMKTYDEGINVSQLCRVYQISRYTFYQWKRLREETGDIKAPEGYQKGHSHKITDWAKFKIFVEEQGHLTLKEMSALWPEPMSYVTVARAMKKLNCTHKKRPMVIAREMKRTENSIKLR